MRNQNKKASAERVRLNLEFPPLVYEKIQEVQKRSHAASLTEVLRRSLALYDLVTEHIDAGGDIKLAHPDGTEETLRLL